MGRILALDFGLKRVGLAVTDPLKIIATPLTTMSPQELFPFLKEYIVNEKVELIVVGWPLNLNNQETDATAPVRLFIEKLQKNFPDMPIQKIDERFTSKIATQAIRLGGAKKMQRRDKKLIDKVSASLILQSYLGI